MGDEAQLEKAICAYARKLNILAYKFSSPSHRAVPDRIIIKGGKVLFLELKSPGKRPTLLQERELRVLREHGCRAEWVDSLELAKSLIDTL